MGLCIKLCREVKVVFDRTAKDYFSVKGFLKSNKKRLVLCHIFTVFTYIESFRETG